MHVPLETPWNGGLCYVETIWSTLTAYIVYALPVIYTAGVSWWEVERGKSTTSATSECPLKPLPPGNYWLMCSGISLKPGQISVLSSEVSSASWLLCIGNYTWDKQNCPIYGMSPILEVPLWEVHCVYVRMYTWPVCLHELCSTCCKTVIDGLHSRTHGRVF